MTGRDNPTADRKTNTLLSVDYLHERSEAQSEAQREAQREARLLLLFQTLLYDSIPDSLYRLSPLTLFTDCIHNFTHSLDELPANGLLSCFGVYFSAGNSVYRIKLSILSVHPSDIK